MLYNKYDCLFFCEFGNLFMCVIIIDCIYINSKSNGVYIYVVCVVKLYFFYCMCKWVLFGCK